MKYERLSISSLRLNNDIRAKSYFVNGISICDLYNRLADLEDKIENGTLREIPEVTRLIFPKDEKDPFMLITKEEYSNYLTLKNDYAHAKEHNEKLQADLERLYKNLDKFKSLTRLEAAEEIYEYLDKLGLLKTAPDRIKMFFKRRFGVEVKE